MNAMEEIPVFGEEVILYDYQVLFWLWKSLIFWRLKLDYHLLVYYFFKKFAQAISQTNFCL